MSLDLAVKFKGFIGEKKSLKWLKEVLGGIYFSDLKMPLAIITTDMDSGEQVVITKGSVLEAVRASIALPVLFTPIKSQGRFLVDGGFSNPLPVDTVKKLGANFVIASNVVRTPEIAKREFARERKTQKSGVSNMILSEELERAKEEFVKCLDHFADETPASKVKEIPNMFNVLVSSVYTMEYALVKAKMRQADLTISPDIRDVNMLDFFRGREIVAKGYEAASKRLERFIRGINK